MEHLLDTLQTRNGLTQMIRMDKSTGSERVELVYKAKVIIIIRLFTQVIHSTTT